MYILQINYQLCGLNDFSAIKDALQLAPCFEFVMFSQTILKLVFIVWDDEQLKNIQMLHGL